MFSIDYQDKRPIYEQVMENLQNLIVKGALEADSRLPSVRSFAMELSINPNTIQRAYAELEKSGFIYTVKGRGNFVSDSKFWIQAEKKEIMQKVTESIQAAARLGVEAREIEKIIGECYGRKLND
ncbi:MAG TPA: GntR family transcriptional regulator [Lachnospiraceae bacterium]|nr:GntR family transcriptional regulator [Lachnospiraceae bacterium]